MSLQLIHLSKLLKILYSEPNRRVSALRADIRADIARESGVETGGGDFYLLFWRDAKDHVFGLSDLHLATTDRIVSNSNRRNLYPRLRDGFLVWWNERRRWTNEPFVPAHTVNARFPIPELAAEIK